MSTLQEKRKVQEGSVPLLTDVQPRFNLENIRSNIEEAYKNLSNGVSKWKKAGNYTRYKIGNRKSNLKDVEATVVMYTTKISEMGYKGQIVAELDHFSNIGDPYYMGEPDDIVSYYVKISEA